MPGASNGTLGGRGSQVPRPHGKAENAGSAGIIGARGLTGISALLSTPRYFSDRRKSESATASRKRSSRDSTCILEEGGNRPSVVASHRNWLCRSTLRSVGGHAGFSGALDWHAPPINVVHERMVSYAGTVCSRVQFEFPAHANTSTRCIDPCPWGAARQMKRTVCRRGKRQCQTAPGTWVCGHPDGVPRRFSRHANARANVFCNLV